ncbi:50S ribosomal protein L29 [Candidatus Woesearchaeota archaeon]|nr:50S ribosomal protein L29 [Candidatus Woesearchaeota archaeon]
MAILKKAEIKQMPAHLIKEKINDLQKELIKLNAQVATGTRPENPGRIREIKRTIARLLTKKAKEVPKKA